MDDLAAQGPVISTEDLPDEDPSDDEDRFTTMEWPSIEPTTGPGSEGAVSPSTTTTTTTTTVPALAPTGAAVGGSTGQGQPSLPVAGPAKRPRGRPRKQPLLSPDVQIRIAKGRSKTGCITCRRRKKKCDETKPHCLNCLKNAVVCEGYPERVVWRSGKQRAEDARAARVGTRPQELPVLVDAIETEVDRFLLDHFVNKSSAVLASMHEHEHVAHGDHLLSMAVGHRGLMHALLCFSGSHLPSTDGQGMAERQGHHYQRAFEELQSALAAPAPAPATTTTTTTTTATDDLARDPPASSVEPMDNPIIATVLVLCLDHMRDGHDDGAADDDDDDSDDGSFQTHLEAARFLLDDEDAAPHRGFGEFLIEFFSHHDAVGAPVTTTVDRRPMCVSDHPPLPRFIIQRDREDPTFARVFDGLMDLISRVTELRQIMHARPRRELEPVVDYHALSMAVSLDLSIRSWVGPSPREGSGRHIAAQLYRQCTWIYLWRTLYPSRSTPKIVSVVEEGLNYMRQMPPDASSQTILLMPVFFLGCAAFRREQRPELRKAFGILKRYSHLRHIETAREVIERLWMVMDAAADGRLVDSWDWEAIVRERGFEFLED